ncbi:hypothetical protein [Bacillus sp. AK128]
MAKIILKDKKLNIKSLNKMKDPALAEVLAKAIVHFAFRNGPVETIHSKGNLTESDMKTINKYMTNQLTGLILSMQKGEWYLLDNILKSYKMFGMQWDKADLTKFNKEKQIIIDKVVEIIIAEELNNNSSGKKEDDYQYIDIDYSSTLDEETGVIQFSTSIKNYCFNTDSNEVVGSSSFSFYNFSLYEAWSDVMDIADSFSGDEYKLMVGLKDILEEEMQGRGVLLNSINVEDQYQQTGIGTLAMEKLLSYWTVLGADFVVLQASPPIGNQSEADRGKNIERLVRFYESFGFEEINKGSTNEGPIMIMDLFTLNVV